VKAKSVFYIGILLISMCWSCEKYDGPGGITGIWNVQEITTQGNPKVYNVSVEAFGDNDSTKFIILNFYDAGMDFETTVELKDSIFTIISGNSFEYSIQGTGVLHKKSFTIDWQYSITGDPYVQAHFEKP